MSNSRSIVSRSEGSADYRLRSIDQGDLEDLRNWKNANKNSFFLREDITPEQQSAWFGKFRERADDHMFVVEQGTSSGWEKIGCMGFRLLADEGCVDAYNIIRSRKIEPATFSMSDAFRLMLAHAADMHPEMPIRCKVLTENPAVEWYERNGFAKLEQQDDYVLMDLDKHSIRDIRPVTKSNL